MSVVAFYIEITSDDQLGEIEMAIGNCNARYFTGVKIDGMPFEQVKSIYGEVMRDEL